jgi:hypothetical protein
LNVLNDATSVSKSLLMSERDRTGHFLTLLHLRADHHDIDGKAVLAGGWRKNDAAPKCWPGASVPA